MHRVSKGAPEQVYILNNLILFNTKIIPEQSVETVVCGQFEVHGSQLW
jgi:hypothetical protein